MKKRINQCFVLLAVLMLLVPLALTNLKPNQVSLAENRPLAEPVPVSSGLSAFMRSLQDSLNDRIGFRDGMVAVYSELSANVLHSRNSAVIQGKDGWLFSTEDLTDYVGYNNSPEQVEEYVEILTALDEYYAERGSQLIFMVGPNKSSVYSQYLPEYIHPAETTLLDALTLRLEEEGVWVINPKQALIADRDSRELYAKLDTHWNAYGAEYAARMLTEKIGLDWQETAVTEYRNEEGGLIVQLAVPSIGSYSQWADAQPNPDCTIEQLDGDRHVVLHNPDGVSFVCYRDSFSIAMMPYYTHYFDGPVRWYWDLQSMEETPDYVILQCVERFLPIAVDAQKWVLE